MRVLIVAHQVPQFPGPAVEMSLYCLLRELSQRHEVTLLVACAETDAAHLEKIRPYCRSVVPMFKQEWHGTRTHAVVASSHLSFLRRSRWASAIGTLFLELAHLALEEPRVVQQMKLGYRPASLRQLLATDQFDVVQVYNASCGFWLRELPGDVPSVLYVLSLVWMSDLQFAHLNKELPAKLRGVLEARKLRRYESTACQWADHCVVLSEAMAQTVTDHSPNTEVSIVPFGIDVDYFDPAKVAIEPSSVPTIVFTGLMNRHENVDAATFFVRDIFPAVVEELPNARFVLVGANPAPELADLHDGRQVVVTGAVPDVRPWLRQSGVAVAPLRVGTGGGVRIKILEALAMETPVVSTRLGAEGLDIPKGEGLYIEGDPSSFGARVASLLRDQESRQTAAEAGRRYVVDQHSWRRVVPELEAVYRKATMSRRPEGAARLD